MFFVDKHKHILKISTSYIHVKGGSRWVHPASPSRCKHQLMTPRILSASLLLGATHCSNMRNTQTLPKIDHEIQNPHNKQIRLEFHEIYLYHLVMTNS